MRSFLTGVLCATALLTSAGAQTLTIGVRGGPDSIDPHFTATGTHAESLKHVFDTLVWSGDGLEIEPRLAESWKALNDTTWEFKLRKGVKFHDGSDFTAADVKFSIERIPLVSGPNPRQGSQSHQSPHCAGDHRWRVTDLAERLHPSVYCLGEGCGGPHQGQRQRSLQFGQGCGRYRPLQICVLAAQGRSGA